MQTDRWLPIPRNYEVARLDEDGCAEMAEGTDRPRRPAARFSDRNYTVYAGGSVMIQLGHAMILAPWEFMYLRDNPNVELLSEYICRVTLRIGRLDHILVLGIWHRLLEHGSTGLAVSHRHLWVLPRGASWIATPGLSAEPKDDAE